VNSSPLDSRAGRRLRFVLVGACLAACGFLAACGDVPIDEKYPQDRYPGDTKPRYEDPESIFGGKGLFIGGDQASTGNQTAGLIGVNSLLWRASLDTLSFMPLASADPFGGVIITDWYTPASSPGERFKVTVYILGRELRADGLRASVFHQVNQGGSWTDAPVSATTATDLENAILTRARQMRIAGVQE
jgi:hypothetical protein